MVSILSSSGTSSFMSRLVLAICSKSDRFISFRIIQGKNRQKLKEKKNIVKGETVGDMTCNCHYHKTTQKKKTKTNNHLQKKEATHIQHKYRYSELFLNGHLYKTYISVKGTPYALAPTFLYSLSFTVCKTDITFLDEHLVPVPILSARETRVLETECLFFFLVPL